MHPCRGAEVRCSSGHPSHPPTWQPSLRPLLQVLGPPACAFPSSWAAGRMVPEAAFAPCLCSSVCRHVPALAGSRTLLAPRSPRRVTLQFREMRDDAEVGGRPLWRPSPASLERGPISPCPCEAEWPVGKPRAQAPDRRGFGCWPTLHCQREPGGDSPSHAFTSPSEEWADSASIRGLWAVRGSPALGQILWRLGFSSPQAALGYLSVPLAAVSPSKQRRGDSLSHLFQTASSGII